MFYRGYTYALSFLLLSYLVYMYIMVNLYPPNNHIPQTQTHTSTKVAEVIPQVRQGRMHDIDNDSEIVFLSDCMQDIVVRSENDVSLVLPPTFTYVIVCMWISDVVYPFYDECTHAAFRVRLSAVYLYI